MDTSPSDANGFITFFDSQQQGQDQCNESSIFQDNNECAKQQRNLLNDQTSSFPMLNGQCPVLSLTESGNDLMFHNGISLPKADVVQASQPTPNSGDCASYLDENKSNFGDNNMDTNYSSGKKDNSSGSKTPPLYSDNLPGDSKAKKKAQNRAAQKAFRERKEARLKELEDKLLQSEKNRQSLLKEIQELRKANSEINAENRLLLRNGSEKATKSSRDVIDDSNSKYSFPTKDEFSTSMILEGKLDNKSTNSSKDNVPITKQKTQYTDETGRHVLTVPATWEYLYKLSNGKDFDVTYVMSKLQGQECCHSYGPAYPRTLIDSLVEEAASKE
ncbi:Yap3p [Saccharomyces eubayanus]|uniref:Yap3p n=1 Tax=Saccharomyces eubayanus TaxID=1080349 RepID=UPI0006C3A09A|nr:YAP3-like protein [Saccharomyces eubayanus]KOG96510.1 YAP3-like protein [Saccharomyces eubayanus]